MNELAILLQTPDLAEQLGVDRVRTSTEATIKLGDGEYLSAFQNDLTLVVATATIDGKKATTTLPIGNETLNDPEATFEFEGSTTALGWLKGLIAGGLASAVDNATP